MPAYDGGETYPFGYRAVDQKAPDASGVYTLFTSRRWMYVGESADIRQSLFRHLNEPPAWMIRSRPLSFSFEPVAAGERVSRQQALVAELAPAYNSAAE
jgi:hypothetical protein